MPRTQCRNWHVPDGLSPRIGTIWAAQAPNAGRVRPSTGARCGKAARRDLRGGWEVTPAPTATSGAGCTPSSAARPDFIGRNLSTFGEIIGGAGPELSETQPGLTETNPQSSAWDPIP